MGGEFTAPAVYTATVGTVTDYCAHPVVAYTWTFTMACLYEDAGWDSTIGVAACDGQHSIYDLRLVRDGLHASHSRAQSKICNRKS
jgi:hypothetical protein